ncbi:hypothetical protein HGRIS_005611 [Hohenbuehelia grisea]|uniref:Carboxylesterase type B domain-containing protein n=1 Tax=Hohenbuehelia grisea TaxID=104357 RepID=A0ABR3JYC4_9AGAR
MLSSSGLFLAIVLQAGWAAANPVARAAVPTVKLDAATVTGVSSGSVSKFLGIPFAQPPVGDRRFRLPEPIPAYSGSLKATSFGPSCPQQAVDLPLPKGLADDVVDLLVNTAFKIVFPDSEDCPYGVTSSQRMLI